MIEEFTAEAYPDIHEEFEANWLMNRLTTKRHTTDTEAESMVSVTVQQDTSVIPPMTYPVIRFLVPRPDSPNVHWPLPTTTTTTAATTTTTLPLPPQPQQEILLQRMLEENYDKGHADHQVAYKKKAPQDSIRRDESEDFDVDKAQEETKKKSKQDSPNTLSGSPPSPPPPPPPSSGASGAFGTTGASDSAQAPPPPPPSLSTHQGDQSTKEPQLQFLKDKMR
ncbi:hypothetical protein Tco_0200535 [Tanacetum coccineum]